MKENACFDTLVERLIGCDPVEAIGLGGSRATGKADIHSDYDLYVYVTEEMPLEVREQLFDGLFRIMEYDNMFWEREDDGIFKDGIPIDILYRRIGDLDRTLEPVVTGHQPYNAYTTCMWNNLLNTKILFDRSGRLTQLKQKYDIPYPEELKKNIIKRHQALLFDGLPNYADQLRKAIGRKDLPAMNHRAATFMETYFDLLFALNKTTHPGEKRMVQEAKKLAVVPEHFEQDLEAFFSHLYTDPQKAAADLDRIEQRMKKILNEVRIVPGLDHPEDVRALFEEYTSLLVGHDPSFQAYLDLQNYEDELACLDKKYKEPKGCVYIAYVGKKPAACIAMIRLDDKCCEMKRLYVRPAYRNEHLGSRLVDRLIDHARKSGFSLMRLDTLPFLESAVRLYESRGFVRIPPYNNSPMDNSIFLELAL